jgi:hypothetical protein
MPPRNFLDRVDYKNRIQNVLGEIGFKLWKKHFRGGRVSHLQKWTPLWQPWGTHKNRRVVVLPQAATDINMNRTPSMTRFFDDDESEHEENASGSDASGSSSSESKSVPQQILGAELDVSAVAQALNNSSACCIGTSSKKGSSWDQGCHVFPASVPSFETAGVVLKTNKVLRGKAYQLILSKQRTKVCIVTACFFCLLFTHSNRVLHRCSVFCSSKHVLAPHPKLLKMMRDQKAVSSSKSRAVQEEELNYNVGRMHSILCAKLKSLVFPESVKGNNGQIPSVQVAQASCPKLT